jgi:hypothetical protein
MTGQYTCPECGGQVQATKVTEIWLTLCDGMWEYRDSDTTDIRVYCENDHTLDMADYPELVARNMRPLSTPTATEAANDDR